MNTKSHQFHIPVMGTAFTIDTPYKVARFGISSVVSIGDDELCEAMRKFYCEKYTLPFKPICKKNDVDYRAKRITAYLNLLDDLICHQVNTMKQSSFEPGNDLCKYFELLPNNHEMKGVYKSMLQASGKERSILEAKCKKFVTPGSIDVNVMTKLDRTNIDKNNQPLPDEFSDAISALRGFGNSKINAGIVFSAGFNRRLFAHCDKINDFFIQGNAFKKQIILKVSDYRSSMIQGRFLAKKGIWVSEYRIESGLNCGGHAFATDGLLCGPILEEFKQKRLVLESECRALCNQALEKMGRPLITDDIHINVTYQGGIGTHEEHEFLLNEFNLESTGWATPFLLVPEASTLDMATRILLKNATADDCYLSGVSPLGVPFNTVKHTQSEQQKLDRVSAGRPGSPCPKGHLIFDTEFSKRPVCKASVFYQKRKIDQLKKLNLVSDDFKESFDKIIEKACLCEDLAAPALIEYEIDNNRPLVSTVCAGPNIAYFKQIISLKEMIGHIYGRMNLISDASRPCMFIAELNMYIDQFKKDVKQVAEQLSKIETKRLLTVAKNLFDGIAYYKTLAKSACLLSAKTKQSMLDDCTKAKESLHEIIQHNSQLAHSFFQPV